MKKYSLYLIVLLFFSCYNDDEVYFDSKGNAINHGTTTVSEGKILMESIPYDSVKRKSITSSEFYEDGRVVIGGTRLLFDAFVLVLNESNAIEFKVELPDVKHIRSAKLDAFNNVVFFAADSVVSYAYDGRLNWSKSLNEMFIDAELELLYPISPRVLHIEDNSDVLIFLDCILSPTSRRIAILRYTSDGKLLCIRKIDSDNKVFDDAAKTKNNMLLLAAGRTYSYENNCTHSNSFRGDIADNFIERYGAVSKARFEQKKLSITYMAEDATELSEPLEIVHEIDPIRCLNLTVDGGVILGGSFKNSAFADETMLVEKYNSEAVKEFDYVIATDYEAKPAAIYQNEMGEYSIIGLKENKTLIRARFNEQIVY